MYKPLAYLSLLALRRAVWSTRSGRLGDGRNDDNGLRGGALVGQRDIDARLMAGRQHGIEPRQCATCQLHGRPPARQVDDAHVAPEHAGAQSGAERLGAGFLGGETLGIGFRDVGPALGLGALGLRKDAAEKTFTVPLDGFGNAARVAEIGAQSNYHNFSPRMIMPENRFTLFGIMRLLCRVHGAWRRACG